jgi:two-component system response regulator (stage 0 sporulation protein F)
MSSEGILIVEDDPDISLSLVELLESEGYKTFTAANGLQALQVIDKLDKLPSLMLVDFMMPIMDGKKFLETLEIEKPGYLEKIPTVILTAADIKFDLPPKVRLIKKPVDVERLLEVVENHCRWS